MAVAAVGGHHEFYEIRSGGFRDWLVDGYFASAERLRWRVRSAG